MNWWRAKLMWYQGERENGWPLAGCLWRLLLSCLRIPTTAVPFLKPYSQWRAERRVERVKDVETKYGKWDR